MCSDVSDAPKLCEPTPQELLQLAAAFDALAARIQHSKASVQDLQILISDMLVVYPIEAGRLLGACLRTNGLFEMVGYVHGITHSQYGGTHEERPDGGRVEIMDEEEAEIGFQLRGIAGLFHVVDCDGCPDAVWAIIWMKTVRGWAFLRQPSVFRADLPSYFHPIVSGFDECGPGMEILSRYLDEQVFTRLRNTPEDQARAEMWAHADIHVAGCRYFAAQLRSAGDQLGDLAASGRIPRRRRPKGKALLTAAAKKELVLNFVKEQKWDGTLDELRQALAKMGEGLRLSKSTLCRYLKRTRYVVRGPHRTARNPRAGRVDREAISAEHPADMSGLDAWTMPDDDDQSVS